MLGFPDPPAPQNSLAWRQVGREGRLVSLKRLPVPEWGTLGANLKSTTETSKQLMSTPNFQNGVRGPGYAASKPPGTGKDHAGARGSASPCPQARS